MEALQETVATDAGAAVLPLAHFPISEVDQFMIMLNICAAVCGSCIYCLLTMRQRQSAGQRERYFPGPFVSLAEASQSWRVYRQCNGKSDRDGHVCNFCGFAIKASPAELAGPSRDELIEDTKNEGKTLKRRIGKNKKKS
eukprot:gnl/TRDRNA2_/TRDRNA2_184140_c0_seq1.p1 gnl/TRDRNA2_/TRDRNA2_184140_c0~~gnl/TRDRNA2_/TRDRNA2_184140_c0_seq1.p1  ORF type:complete len:140 (+),score=30.05 gnl/TRDRNA2_/TRDRNA2_184140_c0_seq1:59-478(+)